MTRFCNDLDLLWWESAIFSHPAVSHLALIRDADAVLTDTTLAMAANVLGPVEPGMLAVLHQGAAETLVQTIVHIAAVPAPNQAAVSVPREAGADPAPPAMSGPVKATVVSFRPVIAAIGAELLALLGLEGQSSPDVSGVQGLKPAAIFGTLAAIYRAVGPSADADRKLALYTRLYQLARRAVAGAVDLDGDGIPETPVHAGVITLQRT